MTVNQISVFLENVPGELLKLVETLAANDIDMRALSLADTKDFGIARIIVNDPYNAVQALKANGFISSITPVVAVEIPDRPGSLVEMLKAIAKSDVNVEYTYAFTERKKDYAYMILRADDTEKITSALNGTGARVISAEDIYKL